MASVVSAASSSVSQAVSKAPALQALKLVLRKANDRGLARPTHWLNSAHTFNFASYHDPRFQGFNALRVINEDRVAPSNGFGSHPHRDFEIFSYVVQGALRHADSLGNKEMIRRGDVQFTSAGSGVVHSEFNGSDKELVHFIQIWVVPDERGIKPSYQTGHFTDQEKLNNLRLIVSSDGENKSVKIHSDMRVYASLLEPGKTVSLDVAKGREYYIHVVDDITGFATEARETAVDVHGTTLHSGDGAFLYNVADVSVQGEKLLITGASKSANKPAEILVFDMVKGNKDAEMSDDD